MSNPTITIDWRPVTWSLLWSWVLVFIPTAVLAARAASTSFTVADDAVTVRTGIITKKTEHVELYRVRDVSSSESAFAGGKVTLAMQDGAVQTLQPVRDAASVAASIRSMVNTSKAARNVQHREDL